MRAVVCAADFGFRADASGAVVLLAEGPMVELVDCLEQRPSRGQPLQPSVVIGAVADMAKRYGCSAVWSDFHYSETAREELSKRGLGLCIGPAGNTGKVEVWTTARTLILEQRVRVRIVASGLAQQLKLVRGRPTSGGSLSIEQPRRAGSHGDLAAAFALGLWAIHQAVSQGAFSIDYYAGGASRERTASDWLSRPETTGMSARRVPDDDDDDDTGASRAGRSRFL